MNHSCNTPPFNGYEPTLWSKILHSLPHVNTHGQRVDPSFNPENPAYVESMGVLTSLPAGLLLVTIIFFIILIAVRSCNNRWIKKQGKPTSTAAAYKQQSTPNICALSIIALLCAGSISIGFLGNQLSHNGVNELDQAARDIHTLISHSRHLGQEYLSLLKIDLRDSLLKLRGGPLEATPDFVKEYTEIKKNVDTVLENISDAEGDMGMIKHSILSEKDPIDFKRGSRWLQHMESIRWPGILTLQVLLTFFCVLLFVGSVIRSRWILIIFSFLGLFSIILLWFFSSIYLTLSVATADFCYEPTPWLMHAIEYKVPKEVSSYYLQCLHNQEHPLQNLINASERKVEAIGMLVQEISSTAGNYYPHNDVRSFLENLETSSNSMAYIFKDLVASLKCDQIYGSYNKALVSVCDIGLLGITMMLISSAFCGLLFSILVWYNSHMWVSSKPKDEEDPFMSLSNIECFCSGMMTTSHGENESNADKKTTKPSGQSTPPPSPSSTHDESTQSLISRDNNNNNNQQSGFFLPRQPNEPIISRRRLGTLRRSRASASQGNIGNSVTATVWRRGFFFGIRRKRRFSSMETNTSSSPMGLNAGQYPTLSKQCKTLEPSMYY